MEGEEAAAPIMTVQAGVAKEKPKVTKQLVAVMCACLSGYSIGLAFGYSSPALPDLRKHGILTPEQESWFGSLTPLGAIFGAPVGGLILNKYGRRTAVIFGALPFVTGWLCLAAGINFALLYTGRLLTGIAGGMSTSTVPVYIAEVASKEYRGTLGTLYQVLFVTGILLQYCLGIVLNYSWLAAASIVPVTLMVIFMFFMPETPRYLLEIKEEEEAIAALKWLRGDVSSINEEYNEIKSLLHDQDMEEKLKIEDFKQPKLYKPVIISFGIFLFQQLSGFTAVIFYANDIFKKANFNGPLPSVIIALVQVVVTLISSVLVDRLGRKVLLLAALMLMTVSCATFGAYYYLTQHSITSGLTWLSLASLSVYLVGYAIGLGPVPWIMMSEVFPIKARAVATSGATFTCWSSAFLVSETFPYLNSALGYSWTFWVFGIISLLGVIFVALVVKETKGKSLEEIELEFDSKSYLPISDKSIR